MKVAGYSGLEVQNYLCFAIRSPAGRISFQVVTVEPTSLLTSWKLILRPTNNIFLVRNPGIPDRGPGIESHRIWATHP